MELRARAGSARLHQAPAALSVVHRWEIRRAALGKIFPFDQSRHRGKTRRDRGGRRARHRSRGEIGAPRLQKCLEQNARTRAREIPLSDRAVDPGKSARAGRARDDGWWQNHQGKPRHRSAAGGRPLFLLRRLGGQTRVRISGPDRAAARRRGANHSLEFPAPELGGKAANIIFEDAPIDQAVEGIISGIYFNQGHVCCAGSRLLVQEGVFPAVIRKLRDRIATLRVGNPLDKNSDIGAINSRMQLDKICELVDSGLQQGAELVQSSAKLPAKGYWYPPSFFTGVTASHRIAQEEIFGPVLSVMTFRTPEEAIERANNTPYGLSAGVWTDKGSKIFKIVNKLRAGVVWANTYNKFDPTSPFGGYKESGFGREGGRHGLLPYVTLTAP